jgi:hypothetical protein
MKPIAYLLLWSAAALPLAAQARFTGWVGGGFTEPLNPIGRRLNRGYNLGAGAGISGNRVGALVNFTYNDFGINQNALDAVGAPNGSTRIWAFTFDPVIHFSPRAEGPVDFYITGGGGIYRRTVEFTQPTIATVTLFDPWWGGFVPAQVVTNEVIGSFATTKPGVNGGAGVAFKIGSGSVKVFAEARYHHMFTDRIGSSFIPVTFGVRW